MNQDWLHISFSVFCITSWALYSLSRYRPSTLLQLRLSPCHGAVQYSVQVLILPVVQMFTHIIHDRATNWYPEVRRGKLRPPSITSIGRKSVLYAVAEVEDKPVDEDGRLGFWRKHGLGQRLGNYTYHHLYPRRDWCRSLEKAVVNVTRRWTADDTCKVVCEHLRNIEAKEYSGS